MNTTAFQTRFRLWRLRCLLIQINRVKQRSSAEAQSIGSLVERQPDNKQRESLNEFKELVQEDEAETLRSLKTRAFKVFKLLDATPIGRELIFANGIDIADLHPDFGLIRSNELPLPNERTAAPLVNAFQVSWKLVQAAILAMFVCLAVSLVFAAVGFPTATRFCTWLVFLFLGIAVLVAIAHSLIGLVASFVHKERQSVLSLVGGCFVELAFVSLCSFFAYQLLRMLLKF